jgi:hypothetical protein
MQEGNTKNLESLGTTVIVRTYGGAPRIARVISVTPDAAFVCAPEYFDAIASGEHEPPMVGFPLNDVFEFDEALVDRIKSDRAQWRAAKRASLS